MLRLLFDGMPGKRPDYWEVAALTEQWTNMQALMEKQCFCCERRISHPWEKGWEYILTDVAFLQGHKDAVFAVLQMGS